MTRKRLTSQNNVALNWNNYEVTVALRLGNPDFLYSECEELDVDTTAVRDIFAKKINLLVKSSSSVAHVKSKVEEKLRQLLPEQLGAEVTDLRIGERLSLPIMAELASLIQNSKLYFYDSLMLTTLCIFSQVILP